MNKNWTKENTVTVREAAKYIGIKSEVLTYYINENRIEAKDCRIQKSMCEKIKLQKERYCGVKSFIMSFNSDSFDASNSRNRNKYIDYLELNEYFGAKRFLPNDMLFDLPGKEEFYFDRDDLSYLELKSKSFFEAFGLSEEDKVKNLIREAKDRKLEIKYLNRFEKERNVEGNLFTPAYTEFVEIVLNAPSISAITGDDILILFSETECLKTRNFIKDFYIYVHDKEIVKYSKDIRVTTRERVSFTAYPYEKYVNLALLLFSQKYDDEHKLTQRAFENHIYIEMWQYLAMYYICGWRASDICNNWVYLNLKDNNNIFNIDISSIKEDILNDRISEEKYAQIAEYSIKKLEMSFNIPSKTSRVEAGKLRTAITPELLPFYGKLLLIAEYHHQMSYEGYMKEYRVCVYQNWTVIRDFFGEKSLEITGKRNIQSRKLTKSYLQGIEFEARKSGETQLVAHIVASFARNHIDFETIVIYLKDHGLTGENADLVLYTMLQRGVLEVILYNIIITAFPEAFKRLSLKEQTEILNMVPISALELESIGMARLGNKTISECLKDGDSEEAINVLKAMYEIGQGRGKGKDSGVYCLKRALGFSCENPNCQSCIANMCPNHVLTKEGIPALIEVIKEYYYKKDPLGNDYYKEVLRQYIFPRYWGIINEFMKSMNPQDRKGLRKLLNEINHY